MRKQVFIYFLFALLPLSAQTAKQVLDKTAALVANKQGARAAFSIKGGNFNTSGDIAVKGRMFRATTPQATIWFDGKTQWTYVKGNDEVNVSNPTESELASINPYHFIYMYQNGYTGTVQKKGSSYEVHLKATGKKSISEAYVTVDRKTSAPSQIRFKQKSGWTTIDIRQFKTTKLSDAMFRFNSKDFPTAEVIDLR